MTGLATANHLHYEYRLNGVHRNPRTVHFPMPSRSTTQYRNEVPGCRGTHPRRTGAVQEYADPLSRVQQPVEPMPDYYVGLMSGTSMDGIDAVLVSFTDAGVDIAATIRRPIRQAKRRIADCNSRTLPLSLIPQANCTARSASVFAMRLWPSLNRAASSKDGFVP